MTKFLVWDDHQCDECYAEELDAIDAESAVKSLCDNDIDGQQEGYYMIDRIEDAPRICARNVETGELSKFRVKCEMVPEFHCYEVTEK
jgi:hypothetical protein